MIKIVTDSTCDLPDWLIAEYDITVVPLYINMDDHSYLDGVEITRQEFYERLPACQVFPKTAVPGIDVFKQAYERLAQAGATEILSIHISPTLSSVLEVAAAAAQQVKTVSVTVLDSRNLSLGAGFLTLMAAKAVTEGKKTMQQVLVLLEESIPHTYVFAALETMEFLRRSGRVNGLVSGVGNLLRIKPLLKMNDGIASSERVRTTRRAFQRLIDLVSGVGPVQQLALVHTNAADKAQELWQQAKHLFPSISTPLSVDVTPVLGAHLGPGAVGFACIASAGD